MPILAAQYVALFFHVKDCLTLSNNDVINK
jgi:hypothetical protein